MNVKVYNSAGEETGTMELPEGIFGVKWNADLVHQVVIGYLANRRRNIAHAKTRGEVRGGGKKPWRQKGTGRARHGSTRSPIWKGGGVTHGPRSDKDYTKKINKKMAKKALFAVLSAKARDQEIVVVDAMQFPEGKTKKAAALFARLSQHAHLARMRKGNGVLVALGAPDRIASRAMRNLPYVTVDEARNLNAYDALQYKYVLFPREAIGVIK